MWDRPGVHNFTCPICRTGSVKWALYEQAGVTPEVVDVWDNEATTGLEHARENPNTTEENKTYWMYENHRRVVSTWWHEIYGEQPRDVTVEMANVRRARRHKNKRLRDFVALKDSVKGLDPPERNALLYD